MRKITLHPNSQFAFPPEETADVIKVLYWGFLGRLEISGDLGRLVEEDVPILLIAIKLIEAYAACTTFGITDTAVPLFGTERSIHISLKASSVTITQSCDLAGNTLALDCKLTVGEIRSVFEMISEGLRSIRLSQQQMNVLSQNWILEYAIIALRA